MKDDRRSDQVAQLRRTKSYGRSNPWDLGLVLIQTKVIRKGYNLAHQTENTMFENIAKHPERAQRYAEAMSWSSSGPGFETSHILDCYPWEAVGTIVDVGGGYGSFSMALAERFPTIRCIVQDKPEVVEKSSNRATICFEVASVVHGA